MENEVHVSASSGFDREPTPEAKITTKSKLKPSVTPRTFRRFFAPRDGSRDGSTKRDRNALRELAPAGVNSRERPARLDTSLFPKPTTPLSSPDTPIWERTRSSPTWSRSIDETTPSKRIKICHDESCEIIDDSDGEDDSSVSFPPVQPIRRSRFRSSLGDCLRRQLNLAAMPQIKATYSVHPYFDTTQYYSRPDDVFVCRDTSDNPRNTMPFCSAACHTNSLVAVGDEEGVVKILETSSTSTRKFKQPLLSFQAHNNALLDLQFSKDDKLLATASGDQACQIIDMFTQKAVFSLNGHISSVKQIKFQPGSNDFVLATSSRDGSIQIWDLRCHSRSKQQSRIAVSLSGCEEDLVTTHSPSLAYANRINLIDIARFASPLSFLPSTLQGKNTDRRTMPLQPRKTSSVTAISFLSSSNPHILLSGADSDATVKVWDIRMQQSHHQQVTPLSTTTPPNHHNRYRHFGLTSMAISADASRVYTLCKDSTVYVYSASHLTLGSEQELYNANIKPRRGSPEQTGAGPIYGFRHPKLKVSSFYVKLALRTARDDLSEMLAIGSSDASPMLFPTDERTFSKQPLIQTADSSLPSKACADIDDAQIPIYNHGTALVRGHEKEVTNVSWTSEGNLLTLSDDTQCRVWRNAGEEARELRKCGEQGGRRWGYGWAHVEAEWNDDSD